MENELGKPKSLIDGPVYQLMCPTGANFQETSVELALSWFMAEREGAKLPRIFYVNWFRKDADGKFFWPGYGENSRVLEWIFRRCAGTAEAEETPIGLVPTAGSLNTEGLDIDEADLAELVKVTPEEWKVELPAIHQHFPRFGEHLPEQLHAQLADLEQRLG